MYVRDLPSDVSDDDVETIFESYGEVLSVQRSTFANFPALYNGNRVVEMALDLDIPYFVTIGDYNCCVWYAHQPVRCVICRETGHRGSSCPLSGLCRRFLQPGHMARERKQAWSAIYPETEALDLSVPAAEDDASADYAPPPPEEASSESSEVEKDDEMLSGDDEVVASAPPSPSSSPVAVPVVPAPVSDVPASDVGSALDVPEVPVSVPDVPTEVPSSGPVQDVPVTSAASVPPAVSTVSSASNTHRDKIYSLILSASGELSHDDVVQMSNKGVADFVSRLMDKHRLPPDSRHYTINYVFRIQQKLSDVKKPVKRAPAKLLDCEGPPARRPTRPDRVPSK